jgi:hypothetical protein
MCHRLRSLLVSHLLFHLLPTYPPTPTPSPSSWEHLLSSTTAFVLLSQIHYSACLKRAFASPLSVLIQTRAFRNTSRVSFVLALHTSVFAHCPDISALSRGAPRKLWAFSAHSSFRLSSPVAQFKLSAQLHAACNSKDPAVLAALLEAFLLVARTSLTVSRAPTSPPIVWRPHPGNSKVDRIPGP